jgi:hypothetical protein
MEDRPLLDITDNAIRKHIEHIYSKAMDEKPEIFTVEPTVVTLKEGREAYYNSRIYRNVNGTMQYWGITAA